MDWIDSNDGGCEDIRSEQLARLRCMEMLASLEARRDMLMHLIQFLRLNDPNTLSPTTVIHGLHAFLKEEFDTWDADKAELDAHVARLQK